MEDSYANFYDLSDKDIEPYELNKVHSGNDLRNLVKMRNDNLQNYVRSNMNLKIGDIVFVGLAYDSGFFIIDEKDGKLFADKNNAIGSALPFFPESRLERLYASGVKYSKLFDDIKNRQFYDMNLEEFISASDLFCDIDVNECIEMYCNKNIF